VGIQNEQFIRQLMKKKQFWPSSGCVDAHQAKSLLSRCEHGGYFYSTELTKKELEEWFFTRE